MASKNISLEGLHQFHGANLTLNLNVDKDTFGKVTKHKKKQHTRQPTKAHFESKYSSYNSNYSSIRTSIVASTRYYNDVTNLLEISGGSGHRYSSSLSCFLLYTYLARWFPDLSVASKCYFYKIDPCCARFAVPLTSRPSRA